MSDRPDLSARPDLTKRRRPVAVVPAPDEGVDPIDPHKPALSPVAPAPDEGGGEPTAAAKLSAVPAAEAPAKPAKPKVELPTKDLNLQVTQEVMETIDFAKFKTKLTKREIVQQAVLAYWSDYRPTDV
ncbi:hypothetical protein WMO79_01130 [Micrococcaceae bacterium Sec7.4]